MWKSPTQEGERAPTFCPRLGRGQSPRQPAGRPGAGPSAADMQRPHCRTAPSRERPHHNSTLMAPQQRGGPSPSRSPRVAERGTVAVETDCLCPAMPCGRPFPESPYLVPCPEGCLSSEKTRLVLLTTEPDRAAAHGEGPPGSHHRRQPVPPRAQTSPTRGAAPV